MRNVLILGGSGFVGMALYRELSSYYNVHASYMTDNAQLEQNRHFHQWDMDTDEVELLLEQTRPNYIISALRGNVNSQVHLHQRLIHYIMQHDCRLMFFSSANVFDRFTNYPSYEFDKTMSESIYGRFKIKIENDLLRLPPQKFTIVRVPMIFGAGSPRVKTLRGQLENDEAIEVFPNVVINANHINKLCQQVHYLINRRRRGIFHLGSNDLRHHAELIKDICKQLGYDQPLLKQVYDSNEDRQLSVLPKDNLLPKHLQVTLDEVVENCVV